MLDSLRLLIKKIEDLENIKEHQKLIEMSMNDADFHAFRMAQNEYMQDRGFKTIEDVSDDELFLFVFKMFIHFQKKSYDLFERLVDSEMTQCIKIKIGACYEDCIG